MTDLDKKEEASGYRQLKVSSSNSEAPPKKSSRNESIMEEGPVTLTAIVQLLAPINTSIQNI